MFKLTFSLVVVASLLITQDLYAQYDTIIVRPNYKSHFSFSLQEPVFVSYMLYKGGGDCDRDKFHFKNDTHLPMADDEYSKSGYDKGHLVNAEDFAYDCTLDEYTFRYDNCLPQTPNLNRGIWKKWETTIRKESQTDSLLIICGGIWNTDKKTNGMRIPDQCWKVVYNLHTKLVTHVLLFENKKKSSTCKVLLLGELETVLKYKIPLKY